MLSRWRANKRRRAIAARHYDSLVEQARLPVFYAACGVPDTMLGRFEMVCLHAFLLFRRLGRSGPQGRALAQDIHDRMFADFDRTLREVGIGDMGIGKRIKKLAKNLYGRISAYDAGLSAGDEMLAAAVRRNVFAGADPDPAAVASLVGYMHNALDALDRQDDEALLAGEVRFADPTRPPARSSEVV